MLLLIFAITSTLFAEDITAASATATSWLALAISFITMLGGVVNLLINKVASNRELEIKLASEQEKNDLKTQVAVLQVQNAHCLEEHKTVSARQGKLESEVYALKSGSGSVNIPASTKTTASDAGVDLGRHQINHPPSQTT